MKIYFVTSFFKGFHGGGIISLKLLAEALKKRGHKVYIITTRKIANSAQNIISLPHAQYIPEKLIKLGNPLLDHLLANSLKKLLCSSPPDIIHVHDDFILPATTHVARDYEIPIIATMRNNAFLHPQVAEELPFGVSCLLHKRTRTIIEHYKKVDAVISVSDYIRKELIKAGVPSDKITTIYNLFPLWKPLRISKDSSNIVLFTPGRICKYKGFGVLIEAISLVVEKHKNIRIVIAGKGPYHGKLIKLIKRLNLADYVKLVGVVPYEEIKKLYFYSDIVVFPSLHPEPLGRVPIEAMVAGKPVIASRVGGVPEVVDDGVTGILVPPNDPRALAETIILLVENEDLRREMGRRGRELVFKKFNPDIIVEKHLQLYRSVFEK